MLPYQPLSRHSASTVSPFAKSRSNLFISKLPFNVTDEQLKLLFSQYGTVKSVRVKRPQIHSRTSPIMTHAYAIAYLEFDKEEQAVRAQAEANGTQFYGSVLQVDFYDNSQQSHIFFNPSDVVQNEYLKALFIRGIPKSVSITH